MLKFFVAGFFLIMAAGLAAQSADSAAIRNVLDRQVDAWNRGNIDEFMNGYWKSDSLAFVGRHGVNFGYQSTIGAYHKNYPDTAHMGHLRFEIYQVRRLSDQYYFVLGKFFLKSSTGDSNGIFTLLFRRIRGQWRIVVDHTS